MGKKRIDEYDDGRVIAPMNIDGMPWYSPSRPFGGLRKPRGAGGDGASGDGSGAGSAGGVGGAGGAASTEKLTRRESLSFSFGVLKAVLLVSLVFVGVYFLFILFCINVWFA